MTPSHQGKPDPAWGADDALSARRHRQPTRTDRHDVTSRLGRGDFSYAKPLRDMEDTKRQNGQQTPKDDFSEFGEIRVISRPAPDAEDRLRRLFTLLLGSSASDGQTESPKDPLPDDRHSDNHVETEA